MNIPEKYLRHIWKSVYLNRSQLKTIDGKSIEIISVGTLNKNEGADFQNAKLRLDGNEITGHVEIHQRSSDWLKHNHDANSRYDSVILHVVFEHDFELNNPIPILELKSQLNDKLHIIISNCIRDEAAYSLKKSLHCSPLVNEISDEQKLDWLNRLSESRFIDKANRFQENKNEEPDFDELIYRGFARALGYSENIFPMEKLSFLISFASLKPLKEKSFAHRKLELESIFFSLSGLLPKESDDEYVKLLKSKFRQSDFKDFEPVSKTDWIFFRLRPSNFPTLRLAGLAEAISKNLEKGFFTNAKEIAEMNLPLKRKIVLLESLFMADSDGFWKNHYHFAKESKDEIKLLIGKNRASEVVINIVLPLLWLYSERNYDSKLSKIIKELYAIYPKVISSEVAKETLLEFLGEGFTIKSASFEQGLLELKKNYCDKFRCLECEIGKTIFEKN